MTIHQGNEGVITTTNHAGDWDLTAKAGIKHEMIALQQSQIREAKPAQAILAMRIDSGVVKHQLRLKAV
jgi:lauroyl/myristoyl acyltransferase